MSGRFLGTGYPRLDEKGRLILPAKFRDQLAEGLVMTKGQESCIYVFTETEFDRWSEALQTRPATARAQRDYSRHFFGSAAEDTPDRQGRITVPPDLRDYAGLRRDLAVVGMNTRVEIWDAADWASHQAETESAFSEATEEVEEVSPAVP